MNDDLHLRYPVGKFSPKESYSTTELSQYIDEIENLPAEVQKITNALSTQQLDKTYRDGGWTARQVLHHLADSHMNAYVRFKWTLTEERPMIKAYDEKGWAETPETKLDPTLSIQLLNALHKKWTSLLRRLDAAALERKFIHPDTKLEIPLSRMIATYAWHGQHHLGHIRIVENKV
ncbi:MAG: YfiT family bacillithiol transferase [Chryseolinea sp.]